MLVRPSTPIKKGLPPVETRSAAHSYDDLDGKKFFQAIDGAKFQQAYLSGSSLNPTVWPTEEQDLVLEIQKVRSDEKDLYIRSAWGLRLLNSISKHVFEHTNGADGKALVFRTADGRRMIKNPLTGQYRSPDIVALWETSETFPAIDYKTYCLPETPWSALAMVGEAKVSKAKFIGQPNNNLRNQLTSYLQHHLQFHPELNAVLGLAITPKDYALFYHDADAVQYSSFDWEPGPLYAFVEKLYTRPFQDTSMRILDVRSPNPAWATKIRDKVYVSEAPEALAGPGQRRYTTVALDVNSSEVVFLKDTWRDERRRYFEALLFKQAHKGQPLSGLMTVDSDGYVLDEAGQHIKTTSLGFVAGQASTRHKMRMTTRDIGRPLKEVRTLRQFLCVMYDACAVQRNLYRKCQILHRDISDGNIMLAPETEEYQERCAKGYAEVKFINQVLAGDKECDPKPECLVIDLGNGADLKEHRDRDALTERTGTPRFIARSVSFGEILDDEEFDNAGVDIPPVEGPLGDYSRFMHTLEYQKLSSPVPTTESEVKFTHQLFHDAESTFWVIAWNLARSAGAEYQLETDPHMNFREFFHTMYRHNPMPGVKDPRSNFSKSSKYWKSILHPDLESMGPMLYKMYRHIRPEWAYRPELNPEHSHEALMRLLLAEIVRIDKDEADIPLAYGVRFPPLHPDMLPMPHHNSMNSYSINPSSRVQTLQSLEPQQNNLVEADPTGAPTPAEPTDSGSAEPQAPRPSEPLQQSEPTPDAAVMEAPQEPDARAQLKTQGRSIVWQRGTCELEPPESGTSDKETSA
ncbi:unnamed protein product [Rhizoctonia solani]|uniref:Fungal-type protein kinase domain-containing protein n=1 Tax=Rhizoctonia solani TaxID=456999 RepID=A0A8H3HE72_9AGAM|nr:unnamed protein product [Rhizoctonia solani]